MARHRCPENGLLYRLRITGPVCPCGAVSIWRRRTREPSIWVELFRQHNHTIRRVSQFKATASPRVGSFIARMLSSVPNNYIATTALRPDYLGTKVVKDLESMQELDLPGTIEDVVQQLRRMNIDDTFAIVVTTGLQATHVHIDEEMTEAVVDRMDDAMAQSIDELDADASPMEDMMAQASGRISAVQSARIAGSIAGDDNAILTIDSVTHNDMVHTVASDINEHEINQGATTDNAPVLTLDQDTTENDSTNDNTMHSIFTSAADDEIMRIASSSAIDNETIHVITPTRLDSVISPRRASLRSATRPPVTIEATERNTPSSNQANMRRKRRTAPTPRRTCPRMQAPPMTPVTLKRKATHQLLEEDVRY